MVFTDKCDSLVWLSCPKAKILQNYVTKNLEQFQDTPDLVEDFDSPICLACTTAKIVLIFKNVIPCSWQRYCFWQRSLWSLSKKNGRFFIMPCLSFVILSLLWSCFTTLCHASPDKICTKDKNFQLYNWFPTFWGQKVKFTIHLSLFTITIHPLLFMTLFTPNFCLFKGGCPLYLKQVF